MVRLLQLTSFLLCTCQVISQDVRLLGAFEQKGPIHFLDDQIIGAGLGFRFGLSEEVYYLNVRGSFLSGEVSRTHHSTRHAVLDRSGTIGLFRSFVLLNKLYMDVGAELGYSDRQMTEHYLSSFATYNVRAFALGPAISLRYRALDVIEPFLTFSGTYFVPVKGQGAPFREAFDPLQNSFEPSLHVGVYFSLSN